MMMAMTMVTREATVLCVHILQWMRMTNGIRMTTSFLKKKKKKNPEVGVMHSKPRSG